MNAGCRLFYTNDDIKNITSTWSKIASGNFTCIDGGAKPGTPGSNGSPAAGSSKKNAAQSLGVSNLYISSVVVATVTLLCFF
jgi:hypothetical protein